MALLSQPVLGRWKTLMKSFRTHRAIAIFGLPRGGTNFIAAALHYHPHLFCATEHEYDYRKSLRAFWKSRSIYHEDGPQNKRIDDIAAVVFNKVQAFPHIWNSRFEYPQETRFVFYLRNPVRVHLSREVYRKDHDPERSQWANTDHNFHVLLAEAKHICASYESLKSRYPCSFLSHEYFCCEHDFALPQLHQFLQLKPQAPGNCHEFLRHCGRCGREFGTLEHGGQTWLACPQHRRRVTGCGNFNPLRPIDRAGVRDASWKKKPNVDRLMLEVRKQLGDAVADYFWTCDYSQNVSFAPRLASRAA